MNMELSRHYAKVSHLKVLVKETHIADGTSLQYWQIQAWKLHAHLLITILLILRMPVRRNVIRISIA
jgi:hypothetical protein